MAETKSLLELRKRMKKEKPAFLRQEVHRRKSLEKKWRRPRGRHSKLRTHQAGHAKNVSKGYKVPAEVRGKTAEGMRDALVACLHDLQGLNKAADAVTIASHVGQKTKVLLVQEAQKQGFKILNVKDATAYLKTVEQQMQQRKQRKEKITKEKERKEKELEKKAAEKEKQEEEKKGIEGTISEEEQKELEKKEKDKILTKKE